MRALRTVLVLLVVVGGLAVAADLVAAHLAEDNAADRIKQQYALAKEPEVDIKGFPFLTQVADRRFEAVDVGVRGIEATATGGRTLRIESAKAELEGVRLQGSAWDRATADRAAGRVTITYDDISAALPVVQIAYGGKDAAGDDQVRARVGTTFLGRRYEETLRGTVSVAHGDTIQLRATGLDSLDGIPGLEDFVRKRVDYDWRIEDLPPGVELKKVEVREEGIVITGSGVDVELREPASSATR